MGALYHRLTPSVSPSIEGYWEGPNGNTLTKVQLVFLCSQIALLSMGQASQAPGLGFSRSQARRRRERPAMSHFGLVSDDLPSSDFGLPDGSGPRASYPSCLRRSVSSLTDGGLVTSALPFCQKGHLHVSKG